jgi:hypothetical protein
LLVVGSRRSPSSGGSVSSPSTCMARRRSLLSLYADGAGHSDKDFLVRKAAPARMYL